MDFYPYFSLYVRLFSHYFAIFIVKYKFNFKLKI